MFSAIVTTNQWFDKRLALAHALGSTGGAVPPFLSGLLTTPLANAATHRPAPPTTTKLRLLLLPSCMGNRSMHMLGTSPILHVFYPISALATQTGRT